jgi:hypothetical protein
LPVATVPCADEPASAVLAVDGAGMVLAAVFEELCVLEVPPLMVGWMLIVG